jgi:hypothetical protein
MVMMHAREREEIEERKERKRDIESADLILVIFHVFIISLLRIHNITM